jgi:hypothetical protein
VIPPTSATRAPAEGQSSLILFPSPHLDGHTLSRPHWGPSEIVGNVALMDENPDLMPPVHRRELPALVLRNRAGQAAADETDRLRYAKAIDAHLTAHRLALDWLADEHQRLADAFDFDLVGDTRPAAMWQMAGRCIGIARLILDALNLGYTTEVLHLARALHEGDRLLDAFGDPDEGPLLRTWIADEGREWVRPRHARAAEARFEQRLADAMTAEGKKELERTDDRTLGLYSQFSEATHHRRRWVQEAVAPELRIMLRGPTTVWARRAMTAATMAAVVEEAVMSVGDALERFQGPGWYEENVKPFIASFDALRDEQPLS